MDVYCQRIRSLVEPCFFAEKVQKLGCTGPPANCRRPLVSGGFISVCAV
ncbi:hypothetical protein RIEGSTA812A_PEG_620 [invertebrate metagenome]|uniref:Uncharacterized protein n=1 Tax=invertebrate metagenome TaxID=1711999 RepID=A0A484H5A7_9ZZZZ